MVKNMVWSEEQGKMVEVSARTKGESVKVTVSEAQASELKAFAVEDGFDLTGVSYETEKTPDGKTKKDKDGNPVFVMKDGKKVTHIVPESQAKINSAIAGYVTVAIKMLIKHRNEVSGS